MLTKDIKKIIDDARDVLVGKIPNPQAQIEQITTAMIYKFMDDMDIDSIALGGERQFFVDELEPYAWSKLISPQLGAQAKMNLYTEALEKLPLAQNIPTLFRDIFKGAYLPFRDAQTLSLFLKEINKLTYNNSENLGNGFEYLLSIMGSQGDAGQFRTPRHIIDFIVDVVKPSKTDAILDPACGTAGFLISAYKYILKTAEKENKQLTPKERTNLTENIEGYDISPDMKKLALVNLYLHKFKDPKIVEYDTLTNETRWESYFDVILANPPFMTPKGGIKPHNKFSIKANRSEVLFVDYIMEHINSKGKAGVIVPEGIVFQSANAYKELRKKLVDEKYLYAVVSLPSGVFQPYSGVKTSVLFMDKQLAKKTDKVLFVEIKNDGFDLGAQRREIDKNDIPKALELIDEWQNAINAQTDFEPKSELAILVEKSKIAENEEYNLTASRYKEQKDYSNCKWEMVKLGDVANISTGNSAPQDKALFENGIYPFCRTSDVGRVHLSSNFVDINDKLNKKGIEGLRLFKKETILFPKSGASTFLNHRVMLGIDSYVSSHLATIYRDSNKCIAKFLYYLLCTIDARDLTADLSYPSLKTSDIANIEIPLPPLDIQEEIVAKIEEEEKAVEECKKLIEIHQTKINNKIQSIWGDKA